MGRHASSSIRAASGKAPASQCTCFATAGVNGSAMKSGRDWAERQRTGMMGNVDATAGVRDTNETASVTWKRESSERSEYKLLNRKMCRAAALAVDQDPTSAGDEGDFRHVRGKSSMDLGFVRLMTSRCKLDVSITAGIYVNLQQLQLTLLS